jgi:DivIVA domain-containing protein
VGRRTFSTSFRGFDQGEVRAYLEQLVVEFATLKARIVELETELAGAKAQPPPVDVAALTSALGEQTAKVLLTAQEGAEELRQRAEEGASRTLREAQEEATRVRSAAELVLSERTTEATREAERILGDAEQAATAMRDNAKHESEAVIAQAVATGRDMVGQAQAARERVLADLAKRRKAALTQLEALRAGREELLTSFVAAKEHLDRIVDDVEQADEQAREAAELVGRATARAEAREREAAEAAIPHDDVHVLAETAADAVAEALTVEAATEEAVLEETVEAVAEVAAEAAAAAEALEIAEGIEAAEDAQVAEALSEVLAEVVADVEELAVQENFQENHLENVTEEPVAVEPPTPAAEDDEFVPPPAPETFPHDPVPTAVMTGPAVGDPPVGGRVDQLFAQIRADRAEAVEDARSVLTAPTNDEAALEPTRTDVDESYLQRRDLLVEGALNTTTRALKRALADDQNATLERMRTQAADDIAALLELEEAQLRAWAQRATPGLIDGAAAGAKLAEVDSVDAPKFDPAAVGQIAERLAADLVLPIRRRLIEVLDGAAGDRGPDTLDRLNSVFREWRSRIDRAVADAVTEAVSAGFASAVEPGTFVRWVVDDADGPCPDCDDNALSGATALGDPFPTGQTAPPAHGGCRCVLARTKP